MIRTSSILKNCNYRYIHCIHRCLLNEANLKDRKTHNVERVSNEKTFEQALEEERKVFGELFEAGARVENMRHTNASKIIDNQRAQRKLPNKDHEFLKETAGNDYVYERAEPSAISTKTISEQTRTLLEKIFDEDNSINKSNRELLNLNLRKGSGMEALRQPVAHSNVKFSEEVMQEIGNKIRYQTTLDQVLEPHIDYLREAVKSDYDLLRYLKQSLDIYKKRNKDLELKMNAESSNIFEDIRSACINKPAELPKPLAMTLPYIIVKSLRLGDFDFPADRKYTLISYVYNECKNNMDASLYLTICNVDFYNLLVQLLWENFQEIRYLRRVVTEMSVNGVIGNIETVDILDKIVKEMRSLNEDVFLEAGEQLSADEEVSSSANKIVNVGVLWNKDTNNDLLIVENYLKSLKKNLTRDRFLKIYPETEAIVIGIRHTDPFGEALKPIQRTDSNWPDFMRLQPLLHWDLTNIWSFLLYSNEPICGLYGKGFTSIGGINNSLPNPHLRKDSNNPALHFEWEIIHAFGKDAEGERSSAINTSPISVVDKERFSKYHDNYYPGWYLVDDTLERAGRIKN
ncbi:MTG1p putative GTPase peripheral to the mitochondrial inner membrane [Saccharomyces cerevisiae]|nr:MTG1p putative GTPase peripheral to the mitochondrial inner membrane [Saccharomyces boulardii (nom. inval.)]